VQGPAFAGFLVGAARKLQFGHRQPSLIKGQHEPSVLVPGNESASEQLPVETVPTTNIFCFAGFEKSKQREKRTIRWLQGAI
jgi:hypothetical protein